MKERRKAGGRKEEGRWREKREGAVRMKDAVNMLS